MPLPSPDVALVAPYPPPDQLHGGSSGVASYTANLAHSLVAEGAKVTVFAPREPGLPSLHQDGGVTVRRAFDRGLAAMPGAARAAVACSAGVVHLQHEAFLYGGASALPGLLGGLAWLRWRRPTVVTMHQVVDLATVDRSFARLHRVAVPAPVAKGALSFLQGTIPKLASATLVHEHGFAAAVPGALLVPHGVEAPHDDVDRAGVRAALGVSPGTLLALCFGYLAPYKGLELVLDAASLLDDDAGVALIVAGGPHPRLDGRDGYAEWLRERYASAARFTGYVPDGDVHPLFSAADVVLILYPRPFASSGALALALAHGRAVLLSEQVATTLGAPSDLVVASEPVAVASRLRSLAGEPAERDRLAAATRSISAGRSWPEVARRHLQIYEEVRHGRPAVELARS